MEAATTTTSQLTGSDEREKRKKKERARIGGDCTADEGLLSARKLKSNVGSNFSHAVVLSPFDYVALSHLACTLMPLHSFVLQLLSPSCCVWCQLDKFSFFLSPFISNLCRTMSTAISPLLPPLLTRTQAIPCRRRHQPLSLPPQHPLPHQSHSRYNRHRATPCTDPHMRRGAHIGHPAVVALTVRIVF